MSHADRRAFVDGKKEGRISESEEGGGQEVEKLVGWKKGSKKYITLFAGDGGGGEGK